MTTVTDERSEHLGLPLPHHSNHLETDLPRLREALTLLDAAMQLLGLDIERRDEHLQQRAALLEWAAARASQVAYAYDGEGRVQAITTTAEGADRVMAFAYDAQGRVAQVSYPVAGGALRIDSYDYDAQGRVANVTSTEEQA